MQSIIDKSKELFLNIINEFGKDPYSLLPHVPEALKWAEYLLKKHPEADKEVVRIAVWLHDIGHYPIIKQDHAIIGEKIAEEFLKKENYNKEKLKKVLHCIRAHRCKDVLPQTIEAKIIAFSDSARHFTDMIYLDMAKRGDLDKALDKIERDFRDLSLFPEIKNELNSLYKSSKELLIQLKKIKSKFH